MNETIRHPPASFSDACETIGLSLSDDEIAACGRFLALLLETNRKFNLTAITEPEEAWRRHILESLALLPVVKGARHLADVGSGGGLPGIPLAIALPDTQVTLIESTGKKARFLEQAAAALQLANVRVVNDRSEHLAGQTAHRDRYDVVTARAVGPMRVLLELALPLVRVDGRLLGVKGGKVEQELRDAGDALMLLGAGEVELYELLPGLNDAAVVVEVRKLSATSRDYPRPAGMAKKEPL